MNENNIMKTLRREQFCQLLFTANTLFNNQAVLPLNIRDIEVYDEYVSIKVQTLLGENKKIVFKYSQVLNDYKTKDGYILELTQNEKIQLLHNSSFSIAK